MSQIIKLPGVNIRIDGVNEIIEKLSRFEGNQQKKLIKAAVNDTIAETKRLLVKYTSKAYVKKQSEISATLSARKATVSKPEATVSSKGKILEPLDYKASPSSMAAQQNRKIAAKAKILRGSSMKALVLDGRKAFLAPLPYETKAGEKGEHLAIVQRKGKEHYPIFKLLSTSVPGAIGSDRVQEIVSPMIKQKLAANLSKHIEEVLNK